MPQLVVDNLSPETLEALAKRAKAHGRSPEDEARDILEESMLKMRREAFRIEAKALRDELLAQGRQFPDSADLIREMRDER